VSKVKRMGPEGASNMGVYKENKDRGARPGDPQKKERRDVRVRVCVCVRVRER
jgi:hypothetical protein